MNTRILLKLAELNTEKAIKELAKFSEIQQKSIFSADSNDEVFEELEKLKQYSYRTPDNALKIIEKILSKEPIETKTYEVEFYGKVEGKTHDDLVRKCIEILSNLRYINKTVFELLIKIAEKNDSSLRKAAFTAIESLASYNLYVIRKIGYGVQLDLISKISEWNSLKLKKNFEIVMLVAKKLLNLSFESYDLEDYKTINLTSGSLPLNKDLKKIRKDAISLLEKIYKITPDISSKKEIIAVMSGASHTPIQSKYKEDMENMVISNINQINKFYISIINQSPAPILVEIEKQINRFVKRFKDKSIGIKKIQQFLKKNQDYALFKLFIGHDLEKILKFGHEKCEQIRKEEIIDKLNAISSKNYGDWERIILWITSYYSLQDPMYFKYFNFFLIELGKKDPNFAKLIIKRHATKLQKFLPHLLMGLWQNDKKIVISIINHWVKNKQNLEVCVMFFIYNQTLDFEVLNNIFNQAKASKNLELINRIAHAIWINHLPFQSSEKQLFIKAIQELTKLNSCEWVNFIWYQKNKSILNNLSGDEEDIILNNLVLVPSISYEIEEIIEPLIKKNPKKIVKFFAMRIEKEKGEKSVVWKYSDIPFSIDRLNETLEKNQEIIIEEIFKLIEEYPQWVWDAGRLLHGLFPSFPKFLREKLIKIIKLKDKNWADAVLTILSKYETIAYDVSKEFIKAYGNKYYFDIFIILSKTSVVTGEYGFFEAYKKSKRDILIWKNEKNKNIKDFIEKYKNYLDEEMAKEKQRVEERIELRKRGIFN